MRPDHVDRINDKMVLRAPSIYEFKVNCAGRVFHAVYLWVSPTACRIPKGKDTRVGIETAL